MKIKLGKSELIHFVGIGGIGMSGLALIMKDLGFNVKGSDQQTGKNIERLKKNNFDIAITRAGASSLAELAHLNIPFISIPFPHATDNHQFLNAKRYYDRNCCWILEEKNFNSGDIYKIINQIMVNKNEYFEKKKNLSKLNENETWENFNRKIIKFLNEN